MIRVAHVVEATAAGVRRHVVDLLRHLPEERVETTLIYSPVRADGAFRAALSELRGRVRCVALPMQPKIRPTADLRAIMSLAEIFRAGQFDVIHTHSGKGGLLGRIAAKVARADAATVYTPNASPYRLGFVHKRVETLLCARTDRVIAVTRSERDELVGNGVAPKESIEVIESGIDLPAEAENRSRLNERIRAGLGVPPDAPLVGTAGRISAQKSPLDFVRMASLVRRVHPNAWFVWIGDGELRAEVQRESLQSGISDRIRITGFLDDIEEHLAALDVFCLLSAYESFGYVTVEAMSLGVPVVATDVPGSRDVVANGLTGYLVPAGDPGTAAARVGELIASDSDRSRMGEAGRNRVASRFEARRMGLETARLYESIVNQHGRRADSITPVGSVR